MIATLALGFGFFTRGLTFLLSDLMFLNIVNQLFEMGLNTCFKIPISVLLECIDAILQNDF